MKFLQMRAVFLLLWLNVMAAVLVSGCVSAPPPSADPAAAVRGQGSELLQAIADKDYKNYLRCTGNAPGTGDEKGFLNSCSDLEQRLGNMDSWHFLTSLKTPEVINLIYQVEFSRKTGSGGTLVHQQLMQLVFGKVDGSYRLLGMRIM